jgi:hypothetical protein
MSGQHLGRFGRNVRLAEVRDERMTRGMAVGWTAWTAFLTAHNARGQANQKERSDLFES